MIHRGSRRGSTRNDRRPHGTLPTGRGADRDHHPSHPRVEGPRPITVAPRSELLRHQAVDLKVPWTSLSLVEAWFPETVVLTSVAVSAGSRKRPPPTPVPAGPATPAPRKTPAPSLPPFTACRPGWGSVPSPADPPAPDVAEFCAMESVALDWGEPVGAPDRGMRTRDPAAAL